ncbi:MAG: tyrosine-type recombinase/integrase [Lutibacter sp.]|jgi:site-specific recombinase XerD
MEEDQLMENRIKGVLNCPFLSKEQNKTMKEFDAYLIALGHPLHTRQAYAYFMKDLAMVIEKPFEQADRKDIERFLASKAKFSRMTQFKNRVFVKSFYRKLFNYEEGYPENVKWIKRNRPDVRKNPQDMITEEEYHKLMNAFNNSRDKCLLAMLMDLGLRAGEMLKINIEHIKFYEDYISIWIQTSKTFQGEVFATKCIPYLTTWLEAHPFKNNKKFPLFVNMKSGKRLTASGIRKLLNNAKRKASISQDRKIYPHLFRFTAATRDSLKYTEPILRKKFRWKPNSGMPAYYQNIANEDYKTAVVDFNEELLKCEVCGHKNPITLEFCQNCKRPLRIETAIEQADKVSKTQSKKMILDFFRTLIENSDNPEELLRKMVKTNPEMKKQLGELVEDKV